MSHLKFSLVKVIIFGLCSSLIFLALSIGLFKEVQHKGFLSVLLIASKAMCSGVGCSFSGDYLFKSEGVGSVLLGGKNNFKNFDLTVQKRTLLNP